MKMMRDFVENEWDGTPKGLLDTGPSEIRKKLDELIAKNELTDQETQEWNESNSPPPSSSPIDQLLPHRRQFRRRRRRF